MFALIQLAASQPYFRLNFPCLRIKNNRHFGTLHFYGLRTNLLFSLLYIKLARQQQRHGAAVNRHRIGRTRVGGHGGFQIADGLVGVKLHQVSASRQG